MKSIAKQNVVLLNIFLSYLQVFKEANDAVISVNLCFLWYGYGFVVCPVTSEQNCQT